MSFEYYLEYLLASAYFENITHAYSHCKFYSIAQNAQQSLLNSDCDV